MWAHKSCRVVHVVAVVMLGQFILPCEESRAQNTMKTCLPKSALCMCSLYM